LLAAALGLSAQDQQERPQADPSQSGVSQSSQPASQSQPQTPATQDANQPSPARPEVPTSENTQKTSTDSKPQPATGESPKTETATTKRSAQRKAKKATTPPKPGDGPTRTVVRNGSTADPNLDFSPGMSQDQAARQQKFVNQLITVTNTNLKTISSRSLSPKEQDLVNQIRMYQDQAKKAMADGDMQRAQNLSQKAYLLSKELLPR